MLNRYRTKILNTIRQVILKIRCTKLRILYNCCHYLVIDRSDIPVFFGCWEFNAFYNENNCRLYVQER